MEKGDLEKLGLTKEQIDGVCSLNDADLQPIKADLQKAKDDLKVAQDKVTTTEESLKKFEGVDAAALNNQIEELSNALKQKDTDHAKELADRDFNDLLKECISASNGINAKAIVALLDTDKLRASKNQKEDIAAALKELAQKEDSKMLFGAPDPKPVGTGGVIGRVGGTGTTHAETLKGAIAEHYKVQ